MRPLRSVLLATLFSVSMTGAAFAADAPDAKPAMPALASTKINDSFTGDYVLDTSHASVVFTISHIGYSNYTGRFNVLDAQLHFDAKNPAKSTLKATVTPASVDTHNSTLEAELASKNWFNTDAFPEATFVSKSIVKSGPNKGKITGDLTLMGVTKPMTLDVVFNGGGNDPFAKKQKLGFSGHAVIKRSDFGMSAYIPTVADAVTLDIEAEFFKKD